MRRTVVLSAVAVTLGLAACNDAIAPPPPSPSMDQAAITSIDERVIVVFNDAVSDAPGLARALVTQGGGRLHFTYGTAIKGMAATLPAAAVDGIRRNPNVAYVEADAQAVLHQTTQSSATWGLDRVDQRNLPLSTSYTYNNNGSGSNIYIFDTGVRRTHNDFGGRVQYVPNGASGDFVGDGHGSAEDCHGHGTHVAGTAAGGTWGVAKGAPIWAARVVNCSGSGQVSMAIAAVDWVTANGQRPAVVNMSLGYGDVQSLRDAVETSIAAGVNYAVSAGNGDFIGRPQDACKQSPGGAPNAITVGATSSSDSEASFSNYGSCVDILAPGVGVTSAWYTGNTATNSISGTSMSSPHVAGAIALYLTANPSALPAQVAQALVSNASLNKITLHSRSVNNGTPNRLLYTLFIGSGGGGTPNNPPTASFTSSCTELTCSFDGSGSSDAGGSITGYAWTFGDGTTGSGVTVNKTYASGGTFTVTLTVTDNGGATGSQSQNVAVTAPPSNSITLDVSTSKVRGNTTATLHWSGTTSSVDVFRNGSLIRTVSGTFTTTDDLGRGGGSVTYHVCNAGTSTCSADRTVSY